MLKHSLLFFLLFSVFNVNVVLAADTYGPLKKGDLLWKIAGEIRPDNVTRKQMMVALLRKNPQAFQPIHCNFNSLKVGEIFTIPTIEEIQQISSEEAKKEYTRQNKEWELYRKLGRKIYCPPIKTEEKEEVAEEKLPIAPVVASTSETEMTNDEKVEEIVTQPTAETTEKAESSDTVEEAKPTITEPTILAEAPATEEEAKPESPIPAAPDNTVTSETEENTEETVSENEENTTIAETEIASPFLTTEKPEDEAQPEENNDNAEAENAPALDASKNKLLGLWILGSAILAILLVGVVFYNRGKQKNHPIPQRLR